MHVIITIDGRDKPELSALFTGQPLDPVKLISHVQRFISPEVAMGLLPHLFG